MFTSAAGFIAGMFSTAWDSLTRAFAIAKDVDWFMRAREEDISMVILGGVTLLYQLHAGNMTRQMSSERSNLATVMRLSLERRRHRGTGRATTLKPWSFYDETGRTRVRSEVRSENNPSGSPVA